MKKKIAVVLEGPAGAGKSSLISQAFEKFGNLVTDPDTLLIPQLPRPRSYEGPEGAILAQLKDYRVPLALARLSEDQILLVDRYLLSTIAYDKLRGVRNQCTFWSLYAAAIASYPYITREQRLRSTDLEPGKTDVAIYYVILTPTIAQLEMNRSRAKKVYPFDPLDELMLYQDLALEFEGGRVSCLHIDRKNNYLAADMFFDYLQDIIHANFSTLPQSASDS